MRGCKRTGMWENGRGGFLAVLLVVACVAFFGSSLPVAAEEGEIPEITDHVSDNTYGMGRYDYSSDVTDCYLVPNEDGSITRVEHAGNRIVLETYDAGLGLVEKAEIAMELELFGGFFAGSSHNWFVFGNTNPSESAAAEVFRAVKYTKDWQRVGSCSLYGANTKAPFNAGNLRMAEYGGMLYIHTSHRMFRSDRDGLNHQANVTIEVDEAGPQIIGSKTGVENSGYGYVSHSFDQFINTADGVLTALDLGDAYPRSAILFRYGYPAGQGIFRDGTAFAASTQAESVNILPITPADLSNDYYAYNATGVSLGGYQVSDSHYLVAYSSVDQSSAANQPDSAAARNVYVASLSRTGAFSDENVQTVPITNYTSTGAGTPQLVKLTSSSYLLMWEYGTKLYYRFLDGSGKVQGELYSAEGRLSECEPVLFGGKVTWYTSGENGEPYGLMFYQIDGNGAFEKFQGAYVALTLNGNGGTAGGTTGKVFTEKLPYHTEPELPAAERKGYRFLGWYTAQKGGERAGTAALTKNTTLYAHWQKLAVGRASVSSLKNQKAKTVQVKYGKISGADGYQVIYTQDKSFAKYKTVEAGKKRTVDIGRLKKNKTYYVRVRAYTIDSAGNRVYGKFSAAKKAEVKK